MSTLKRPISPYLTVYRLQPGSFFSIFSRITGIILLVLLLVPFLAASLSAIGLSSYALYSLVFFIFKSPFTCLLFSFLVLTFLSAFVYHLLSATRYLFWSSELGLHNDIFNLQELKRTQGYFVFFPVGLIIFSWLLFVLI
jgi:succinate dehydrogenase cytochrome b556 subunit